MSNVITREYLIKRYVHLTDEFKSNLAERLMYATDSTDTALTVDEMYQREIKKEEDRQIRVGIQLSIESNMKHNNMVRRLNSVTAQVEVQQSA